MQIRPATPADAARLSEIAWQAKAWWGYTPQQMAPWRAELTFDAAALARGPVAVAAAGDIILGFSQLVVDGCHARLEHLWVDPAAMRQGAGKALLLQAAARAAGAGFQHLLIDADPGAAPFYRACGALLERLVPAPIDGAPERCRPQFMLPLPRCGSTDDGAE